MGPRDPHKREVITCEQRVPNPGPLQTFGLLSATCVVARRTAPIRSAFSLAGALRNDTVWPERGSQGVLRASRIL